MSVTKPTLKPEPLEDELVAVVLLAAAVLVVPAAAALLLLLLLLPHAASPRATAAIKRARPARLVLPVTRSPFPED
jgi:hypothetical protein